MADNIFNGTTKSTAFETGNGTTPQTIEGGAGALDVTNKGKGTVRLRDDGLPDIKCADGSVENIGLDRFGFDVSIPTLTANVTNTIKFRFPRKGIVTAIRRSYNVAPASAGGTVVANVKNASGNDMLLTSSENEEGLSSDPAQATAHNLTGTAANLKVQAGDRGTINITSNNADMTGGSGGFYIVEMSSEDHT